MNDIKEAFDIPVSVASHDRTALSACDLVRWHAEYDSHRYCRALQGETMVLVTTHSPEPRIRFEVLECPEAESSGFGIDERPIGRITLYGVIFEAKWISHPLLPQYGDRHLAVVSLGALPLWLKGMQQLTPEQRREVMHRCGCEVPDPWYLS